MSNSGLNAAKAKKYDEFYTRRQDIEAELRFYRDEFAGKTVYCNCDDPWESEFVQYFCRNFRELGLESSWQHIMNPTRRITLIPSLSMVILMAMARLRLLI